MKAKKFSSGEYFVTVNNHSFDVKKNDNGHWSLWNMKGTELYYNFSTKANLLRMLDCWSQERTQIEATKTPMQARAIALNN
jgi:hypothetical protein